MYEANIEALTGLWPSFREEITAVYTPAAEAEGVITSSGLPGLKAGGIHLTSRRDPSRDAERIIERQFPRAPDYVVFLHFGLGYELEALWRRYPRTPVCVLEPDIPLFLRALSLRDFRHLFTDPALTLLLDTPPEALGSLLNDRQHEEIRFVPLRSVARLHPDYLAKTAEWFRRFSSRREINRNTLKRFGRVWVRNLLANIPVLSRARPVGELEGLLEGKPCLILAAGPTLDEIGPHIEALRERMALIAVDTSAAWCAARKIDPDFLIVVDPQYWNTRHLDVLMTPQRLISESSTHPGVFRRIQGSRYFASSLFPLGSYLEEPLKIYGALGAGGSVATTAWDFARFVGAGTIYFAGLDLGFPGMLTHYKGSLFEELAHLWSERTNGAMNQSFRYIRDGSPVTAASTGGIPIVSDRRLALYRWWFENRLRESGNPPTFTLSPNGVAIPGMDYADPAEALNLPPLRTELNTLLPALPDASAGNNGRSEAPPGALDHEALIHESLTHLDRMLADIEELCTEALAVCDAIVRGSATAGHLSEIEARLSAHPAKDIAGFLIDPHPEGDAMEASRLLYTAIRESVRYHRERMRDYGLTG